VEGLQIAGDGAEARIVGGVATWAGQSLEDCQRFIQKWGLDAFLAECQHESVAQRGRYLASIGLWDACAGPLPALGKHEPVVLAVDAGESSDTFALCMVSRHPDDPSRLAVRMARAYVPEQGRPLDFDQIEQDIRALCAHHAVVELAYDRFLMGQIVRRLEGSIPCALHPFSQAGDRLEADKALRDAILSRTLAHDGQQTDLRAHLDNANAKLSADGRQLRIVKRSQAKKIDLAVALSMAHARAGVVLPLASLVARPAPKANPWKALQ
jgi:phage terminase large subunit-like protein